MSLVQEYLDFLYVLRVTQDVHVANDSVDN